MIYLKSLKNHVVTTIETAPITISLTITKYKYQREVNSVSRRNRRSLKLDLKLLGLRFEHKSQNTFFVLMDKFNPHYTSRYALSS